MALKKFIVGFLITLGIAGSILVTDLYFEWLPFLARSSEYPIKLSAIFILVSAWVTLFLAFTAVRTIEESNDREQREKTESKQRENRDREERWLKEIKDWATNLLIAGGGPGERNIFERPEEIQLFKVSLFKLITELRRLNREGMAFRYIDLPNWKGLVKKSKNLRKAIGVQVGLIDECSKSLNDTDKYKAADDHRGKLNDIAESIIKEAQNIRSNFLKST